MKKVKVIAIIGESGAGKDTVLESLVQDEGYHRVVTSTTRTPREGEVDGVDYNFLQFQDIMDNENFHEDVLESFIAHTGDVYFTTISSMTADKINAVVLNPTGAITLCENRDLEVMIVRLVCNPQERVCRQIMREKDFNLREINRRYWSDYEDFEEFEEQSAAHYEKIVELTYDNNTPMDAVVARIKTGVSVLLKGE